MNIQRTFYTSKISEALQQVPIVLLIGARQVGKTTILQSLHLNRDTIYLDGQDVDVASLFVSKSTIESYLKINLNEELDGYLIIDEFQFIDKISTILKLLTDHNKKLKVICSGSSSIDIFQQVEESLAGRIRVIEVFSLSFNEYLAFVNIELYEKYQKYTISTENAIIDKEFFFILNDYLIYGGLPRVALEKKYENKIDLLDDIYKTYLLRDVRSFVKNEDFVGFNRLLRVIASQIGNMINVNNLSKSCGLNYRTTEEYMSLLEQMFIIKFVEPYYSNKKKVITKMKKVFFTDIGLRNIVFNDFKSLDHRLDNGSLFENYVFLELYRKTRKAHRIYYYRTIDGSEVDFVINTLQHKISVEAKYAHFDNTKYFKNIIALNNSENITQTYIINQNFNIKHENIQYLQGVLLDKIHIT